ncbi:hypothetical protein [Methanolobus psychrotolerans]|uniref:hypothetical protein n=1 Tax=Methanolobus psychrotolerans TaxID=1874706 RepID=UPI00101AE20D|nr:hypothetical protein [Methanolobus psychrotolerans]
MVKKTIRYILSLFCILAMILLFSSLLPMASANNLCACDNLDTCVEWVSEGTLTMQWGRTASMEVSGIDYTFRADDFDEDMTSALIFIEKGGVIKKEFLFLKAGDDRKWFEWDDEIKVELTGVSEDGQKTPSAQIAIYSRGRPELEISIDASSETVDGVDVSSEQYAPGEKKQVDVKVTNTGDAWIENVVLEIDIGEFWLKAKGDFEYRNDLIRKDLGCLEKGDTATINFTVVAPEWDGKTSPYELVYYVNATAGGYDIKDGYFDANSSSSFVCTEPGMKVVFEIVNDEINMSSWYVRPLESSTSSHNSVDYEIRDAWEHSFLRTNIFNIGLYTIDDIDIEFSVIPDDIVISETYESGDYSSMDPDGQYYLGQKLVPIRPGTYSFGKVVVNVNFFGENLTWGSDPRSITVHGPHIVVDKILSGSGSDYSVSLGLSNDGDRAAWINLVDIIPDDVSYVAGSVEQSLAGSDLPLSDWDLEISEVNGSRVVSVEGVLLPPGSKLTLGYEFNSDDAPDLPPAVCEFRGIGGYDGEAQSSLYVDGREVKQHWDPFNGGWIVSGSGADELIMPVVAEPEPAPSEEDLYSLYDDTSDLSMEVQQEPATPTFFSKIVAAIEGVFDKLQQFVSNTFGGMLSGVFSLFGMVETAAIDAVENYLYAIVIVIALAVFGVVYTLISK